jgi:integrase
VVHERSDVGAALAKVRIGPYVAMPGPFGPLFRQLIVTLARREEVARMRWSELAADLGAWAIPGVRMKRGQAHAVAPPEAAACA